MLDIKKLHHTIQALRGPEGCPWDKKQNFLSLIKYLEEEAHELIEALEKDDIPNICEEIGDVLYILMMLSEIGREKRLFSFNDVIEGINKKLIFRHPHVFGDVTITSEHELREIWENAKQQEKKN